MRTALGLASDQPWHWPSLPGPPLGRPPPQDEQCPWPLMLTLHEPPLPAAFVVQVPPEPFVTEHAVPEPLELWALQWLSVPDEEHVARPVAEHAALPSSPWTEHIDRVPNAEHDCVDKPPPSTLAEQRPPFSPFCAEALHDCDHPFAEHREGFVAPPLPTLQVSPSHSVEHHSSPGPVDADASLGPPTPGNAGAGVSHAKLAVAGSIATRQTPDGAGR